MRNGIAFQLRDFASRVAEAIVIPMLYFRC
jgi:hypothetical protein